MNRKPMIRQLNGTVVSNKMTKTVVVKVNRTANHPKYGKQYVISKNYQAHDPLNQYQVGDQVTIFATRPRSKTKRWQVKSKPSTT